METISEDFRLAWQIHQRYYDPEFVCPLTPIIIMRTSRDWSLL